MRKIWTQSPGQGQSPSSEGHPGVEEQTSPTAPRTPPTSYKKIGDEGTHQLFNKGSDTAGPSRPGTDCRPVMPVPLQVVKRESEKENRDNTILGRNGSTPYNQPGPTATRRDLENHTGPRPQ